MFTVCKAYRTRNVFRTVNPLTPKCAKNQNSRKIPNFVLIERFSTECRKYFRNCSAIWFCIATLCDWLKMSRHFLDQSEVKPKPIVTYSHAFSRAWHGRHVFASSSDWFIRLFTTVVIGQSNYFGFGFTTDRSKTLKTKRYHANILPKRFHLNGHTIEFR